MIKIVTHNGLFHADDVFAVALLKSIMADCEIERTRTPEIIEKADIVIDVGGVYDPSKGRFDHHQKDGVIIDGRSRASFGLVWIEYGRSALRQTYPDKTKGEINEAFNLVQKNLVDPVDAGDTGESVNAFKKIRESGLDVPPMHTISQTIHDFNPAAYSGENFDKKFEEATDFAIRMIKNSMNQSMGIVLSRKHILGAVNNIIEKPTLDASGRPAASRIGGVLILPEYAPWNDVINKNENMDIKRVIWRDETSGNYLCQQTPWAEPFPETWRGKRDQDLDKVMGITDGVFCHNGGFISGFKSLESALIAANTDIKADLNKDMDSIKDRHHEIKVAVIHKDEFNEKFSLISKSEKKEAVSKLFDRFQDLEKEIKKRNESLSRGKELIVESIEEALNADTPQRALIASAILPMFAGDELRNAILIGDDDTIQKLLSDKLDELDKEIDKHHKLDHY